MITEKNKFKTKKKKETILALTTKTAFRLLYCNVLSGRHNLHYCVVTGWSLTPPVICGEINIVSALERRSTGIADRLVPSFTYVIHKSVPIKWAFASIHFVELASINGSISQSTVIPVYCIEWAIYSFERYVCYSLLARLAQLLRPLTHLSFFWYLWKAVLCNGGIFRVPTLILFFHQ